MIGIINNFRIKHLSLLVIILTFTNCEQADTENGNTESRDVIQAFDLGEVQLLPGMMYDEFQEIKEYYYNISNDDMLYEYRLSVGETDLPGERLGGWYKRLWGLTLNQWISSYSRIYAITGEERFKEKAEYLFDEWWRCYRKGIAMGISGCATNTNNGNNDKWTQTILDIYLHCDREDALEKLEVFVDWAQRSMDTTRLFGHNSLEWWTITRPLYLAYTVTGNEKYREYAKFWEYTDWWDMFAYQPIKPFMQTPVAGNNKEFCHAYSHTNALNSAAQAYRVTGDKYYFNTIKNYYDWMQNCQIFATGGYGPELEHIMPMPRIINALETRTDHFETQCASWSALLLSQNLIELTGDSRYGNWIERLAYNAINATIPDRKSVV